MIRVAIIGVGNCAKSLVEGIAYYTNNKNDHIGLMHPLLGEYHPSDIEFVAAFDVDKRKVGKELHNSIKAQPNNTSTISKSLRYDFLVHRGPTLDGIISQTKGAFIIESDLLECDVTQVLRESNADIVLNYVPSGSDEATYAYAKAALDANCSFINCMSTPLAKDTKWQKKFQDKGLVLIGDDIKSQLGSTIINHALLRLLKIRGTRVTLSEQINYGGNADHFNLKYRQDAKKSVKLASLKSCLTDGDIDPIVKMVYTENNYDKKLSKILISGEIFGRIPWSIDVKVHNEDSPNSAGVVVDAIRITKLLIDNKKENLSKEICSYLMKSPPIQFSEEEGFRIFNEIISKMK